MFFVSPPLGPAFGVKPLLDSGAEARAKDPAGNSILTLAAASEGFPVAVVKALLDHGADVNARTPDGQTALDWAKRHGQTPMVELLLEAGERKAMFRQFRSRNRSRPPALAPPWKELFRSCSRTTPLF